MLDTAQMPAKPPTVRPMVPLVEQVDGRRKSFKRFAAIVSAFGDEIGGVAGLSAAQATVLRNAAALQLRAEQLEAQIMRGEPADGAELARLVTVSRRLVKGLRARTAAPAAA
jgi:hypothetical protein